MELGDSCGGVVENEEECKNACSQNSACMVYVISQYKNCFLKWEFGSRIESDIYYKTCILSTNNMEA